MKNYRIKGNDVEGYVVQKRVFLFFWYTVKLPLYNLIDRFFYNVCEAKEFIRNDIEENKVIKETNKTIYL